LAGLLILSFYSVVAGWAVSYVYLMASGTHKGIALEMPREAKLADLPDIPLEEGDRLYVPPTPAMVSVFGSVFYESSFLHRPEKRVEDYLAQAGGTTKRADTGQIPMYVNVIGEGRPADGSHIPVMGFQGAPVGFLGNPGELPRHGLVKDHRHGTIAEAFDQGGRKGHSQPLKAGGAELPPVRQVAKLFKVLQHP